MPFYNAQYGTNADDNGRMWPLGDLFDMSRALADFNAIASKELGSTLTLYDGPQRFL